MSQTFSGPTVLGGGMEGVAAEMKGITRKKRPHFMFASTVLGVEVKNSLDTGILARSD